MDDRPRWPTRALPPCCVWTDRSTRTGLLGVWWAIPRWHRLRRSVHIASFLPRDGRSLLDDWGPDEQQRRDENGQVRNDGMLWAPPLLTNLNDLIAHVDEAATGS